MSKLIIIDGDILVYRSACAAEKKQWHQEVSPGEEIIYPLGTLKKDIPIREGSFLYQVTIPEDVSHACYNAKHTVRRIMEACSAYFAEDLVCRIYISAEDKSNYRYSIAKTRGYKENRKSPKPVHYHAVRKYLVEKQGAIEVFGQEADDELGIVQTENNPNSCIVSIDKDLLMIPGWHYNFVKEKFTQITPEVGAYNFYSQMLTGDTVDNIPGIKGVGPKGASKLLHPHRQSIPQMHAVVEKVYAEKATKEYLLEMGGLLWLRRQREQRWSGLSTVLGQD